MRRRSELQTQHRGFAVLTGSLLLLLGTMLSACSEEAQPGGEDSASGATSTAGQTSTSGTGTSTSTATTAAASGTPSTGGMGTTSSVTASSTSSSDATASSTAATTEGTGGMSSTVSTTGSGGGDTTGAGGTGGGGAMHWVGAWATGPQLTETNNLPPDPGLAGNTLRQIVFPTLSGSELRVRISNEFGNGPVTLNAVHLAASTSGSSIDTATDQALSFDGMPGVTIAAGEAKYSDPLSYPLTALSKLSITIAFGDVPSDVTGHPGSRTTSYLQSGQMPSAATLDGGSSTEHWYYISGIDVMAPEHAGAIVTLGDSITDGRGSTTDGNNRWPDNLARRLQADPATQHISVLNQGIGGNAVLSGGLGPTALARFERDVLNQSGVRWVVVLEGVNDIGNSSSADVAEDLIGAYQQFIQAAHGQGLLIYGVPILPFGGSQYDSAAHEEARQAVNDWIRTSGEFDAVIDLDAAVRDPNTPTRLLPAYDDGDQLHLSVAGYEAMADAIDLSLFQD